MAQLGGQPVLKKDAAPLSDDLDSQTPLRITEFKRDVLGRLIHTLARDNDKVQETAYQYDLDGNLIHRELADGEVQNYFYDLHDQLVKAEIFKKDGSKETWAYSYDALGRRIGKDRLKTSQEVSDDLENQTRFVWDGSHLLQEVHSDGRYTYIYTDPDSYEPLVQVRDWTTEDGENRQQTHYFHCDQIGIPREMTDKDGNLLWFGNYTGWGRLKEETTVTDSAYQPFRLQNQYADRETGLHYNFFRYYEPECGRFINQDSIGLAGVSNLYWALQNSQMWADPLGLSSKKSPGTCNDPCAGQDPASEAAGWQGSEDYPGVDNWKNVVLEKRNNIVYTVSAWAGRYGFCPWELFCSRIRCTFCKRKCQSI